MKEKGCPTRKDSPFKICPLVKSQSMARSGNFHHSRYRLVHPHPLLQVPTTVVRNYRKLTAIVSNAQKMIDLDGEHGTFQKYLRSQGDFDATLNAVRNDFKFMGPTGIYFFLYVVGEQVPPHDEFEAAYRK